MSEEKNCQYCNQSALIKELPGEFRDFDADNELHGTIGLPLCSNCLGTGKTIDNESFKKLSEKVSAIRQENLKIQIQFSRGGISREKFLENIKENNESLRGIAKRALKLVKNPVKECYAKTIA